MRPKVKQFDYRVFSDAVKFGFRRLNFFEEICRVGNLLVPNKFLFCDLKSKKFQDVKIA